MFPSFFDEIVVLNTGSNKSNKMHLAELTKAIELNPNLAAAYNNRGYAYLVAGEYNTSYYSRGYAYLIEREYNKCHYRRKTGLNYLDSYLDSHDKAIDDLTKVIELNPNLAAAYNNRGCAYLGQMHYDKAIDDLTKAIELNPNLAAAYNNRGCAYRAQMHCDKAIDDLTKAIELNSDDEASASYYNNRGCAYLGQMREDKAIDDLTEASALDQNLAAAHHNLARACFEKMRDRGILHDMIMIITNPPIPPYSRLEKDVIFRDRGIASQKKAIELDPKLAEPSITTAYLWRLVEI